MSSTSPILSWHGLSPISQPQPRWTWPPNPVYVPPQFPQALCSPCLHPSSPAQLPSYTVQYRIPWTSAAPIQDPLFPLQLINVALCPVPIHVFIPVLPTASLLFSPCTCSAMCPPPSSCTYMLMPTFFIKENTSTNIFSLISMPYCIQSKTSILYLSQNVSHLISLVPRSMKSDAFICINHTNTARITQL